MFNVGDKVIWQSHKGSLMNGVVKYVYKDRNMSKVYFVDKAKSTIRNDRLKLMTKIFEYLYG